MEDMELDTDQISHLAKRALEKRRKADELRKQIGKHDRAASRAEHDLLVACGLRDPARIADDVRILGPFSQMPTSARDGAKVANGHTQEQDNGPANT